MPPPAGVRTGALKMLWRYYHILCFILHLSERIVQPNYDVFF